MRTRDTLRAAENAMRYAHEVNHKALPAYFGSNSTCSHGYCLYAPATRAIIRALISDLWEPHTCKNMAAATQQWPGAHEVNIEASCLLSIALPV